eukprot:753136-Hanusia_phi.AAC.3
MGPPSRGLGAGQVAIVAMVTGESDRGSPGYKPSRGEKRVGVISVGVLRVAKSAYDGVEYEERGWAESRVAPKCGD